MKATTNVETPMPAKKAGAGGSTFVLMLSMEKHIRERSHDLVLTSPFDCSLVLCSEINFENEKFKVPGSKLKLGIFEVDFRGLKLISE